MIAAAVAAVGAFRGYSMACGHYEPLLADANKKIGTLITANYEMKGRCCINPRVVSYRHDKKIPYPKLARI